MWYQIEIGLLLRYIANVYAWNQCLKKKQRRMHFIQTICMSSEPHLIKIVPETNSWHCFFCVCVVCIYPL